MADKFTSRQTMKFGWCFQTLKSATLDIATSKTNPYLQQRLLKLQRFQKPSGRSQFYFQILDEQSSFHYSSDGFQFPDYILIFSQEHEIWPDSSLSGMFSQSHVAHAASISNAILKGIPSQKYFLQTTPFSIHSCINFSITLNIPFCEVFFFAI